MNASIRVVCIGGVSSSGTTLLADLLDSVPGALCPPELSIFCFKDAFRFDAQFKEAVLSGELLKPGAPYAVPAAFVNRRHLSRVGLENDEDLYALVRESCDLRDFVARFARRFADFRGRELSILVEKTPINLSCAAEFCRVFPDGLFVHVVRDGRSVVASLVRRGYSIYEAALIWLVQMCTGLAIRGLPNVIEVRYEDLVRSPFRTVAQIAKRAGVAVAPRRVAKEFASNEYRAGLPRIRSWSVSKFTGTVHTPAPFEERLSEKNIAWLEHLHLYAMNRDEAPAHMTSFRSTLSTYRYNRFSRPGVNLSLDRMRLTYVDYLQKTTNLERQRHLRLFMRLHGDANAYLDQATERWRLWAAGVVPELSTAREEDAQLLVQLGLMHAAETSLPKQKPRHST